MCRFVWEKRVLIPFRAVCTNHYLLCGAFSLCVDHRVAVTRISCVERVPCVWSIAWSNFSCVESIPVWSANFDKSCLTSKYISLLYNPSWTCMSTFLCCKVELFFRIWCDCRMLFCLENGLFTWLRCLAMLLVHGVISGMENAFCCEGMFLQWSWRGCPLPQLRLQGIC